MAQAENPARERILARIRAATSSVAPVQNARGAKAIFAAVTDPLERFRAECTANATECIVVESRVERDLALSGLLGEIPEGEIFAQDSPKVRKAISPAGRRQIRWSSEGAARDTSQAGVTLAEALVAQTGSVVISAACGGRGGSLVPPVHIVLAHSGQMAPDLPAAMEMLRSSGTLEAHSFVSVITGPSRTADIEKILVLGAHGPRRLVVLLSREPE
jgi:L-lactate dehydrogenase complex protein LldG